MPKRGTQARALQQRSFALQLHRMNFDGCFIVPRHKHALNNFSKSKGAPWTAADNLHADAKRCLNLQKLRERFVRIVIQILHRLRHDAPFDLALLRQRKQSSNNG
jgi:hypothetical protein